MRRVPAGAATPVLLVLVAATAVVEALPPQTRAVEEFHAAATRLRQASKEAQAAEKDAERERSSPDLDAAVADLETAAATAEDVATQVANVVFQQHHGQSAPVRVDASAMASEAAEEADADRAAASAVAAERQAEIEAQAISAINQHMTDWQLQRATDAAVRAIGQGSDSGLHNLRRATDTAVSSIRQHMMDHQLDRATREMAGAVAQNWANARRKDGPSKVQTRRDDPAVGLSKVQTGREDDVAARVEAERKQKSVFKMEAQHRTHSIAEAGQELQAPTESRAPAHHLCPPGGLCGHGGGQPRGTGMSVETVLGLGRGHFSEAQVAHAAQRR